MSRTLTAIVELLFLASYLPAYWTLNAWGVKKVNNDRKEK